MFKKSRKKKNFLNTVTGYFHDYGIKSCRILNISNAEYLVEYTDNQLYPPYEKFKTKWLPKKDYHPYRSLREISEWIDKYEENNKKL